MLYYWYPFQWPGGSQCAPLWYVCKARPGVDRPRGQLFHAGDRKDAHAKVFTIQRRCVPKHHALLLVPLPVVWQIAGRTVVVCVQGPSRCRQTTRTTLTRWGSASIIQPPFNPIFRHVKNRNDSTFAAYALHLDQACQTLLPCQVLFLFLYLCHCLFLLFGSVCSGLWLKLRHGRKLRNRHVELQQLRRN